jgi:hypothetical protein
MRIPMQRSLFAAMVLVSSGMAADLDFDAYIKASNTEFFTKFGQSVALSGSTLVVGSPLEKSGSRGVNGDQNNTSAEQSGAVYVYVRSGTEWVQQAYLKASNADAQDHFGASVAISGNTIVVGAPDEDSAAQTVNGDQTDNSTVGAGAAYVFIRTGTSWVQQAYLKGSNTDAADSFGQSVAIDGNTIAVGAHNEDGASGAAYLFARSGSSWGQQARVRASNADANDGFGSSVALAANTLIVGAPREESRASDPADDSGYQVGAVYIYGRTGNAWSEQKILKASTVFNDDRDLFGSSVAISGDTIVVGASGEDSNAKGTNGNEFDNSLNRCGAAYVFTRGDGTWPRQAYLKGNYPANLNDFGASVAISGDRVLVGCPGDDLGIPNTTEIGAAYLFERVSNVWSYAGRLVPEQTSYSAVYYDEAGTSVALSGDVAAVGAPGEDGPAKGTHGDPKLNGENDSGAAFVFYVGAITEGIAKTGVTAPGGPGIAYGKIGAVSVDSSAFGGLLFQAAVTGPGAPAGQTQAMFDLDYLTTLTWMCLRSGAPVGGMLGLPAAAKVSALSAPVNTGFSRRGWFQGTVGTSRVIFVNDNDTVKPVIRTGQPLAALSNLSLASIREMLPATHVDQLALLYTLKGATAANDSGLLIVDHNGAVVNASRREGSSYFGMGAATFGQFVRGSQVHSGTRFIVKMIQGSGQPAKDTLCSPTQAFPVTQGDLAGGTSSGERYGTFLGLGRASIYGLLRATLTNCPVTTNEGLWLDNGVLVARKGQDLGNGLKIARIIRVWGNDAPEYVLHVVLSGTGVTPANNVALVTKPHNGAFQMVVRTGSPVPGISDARVRIKSFSAVDATPNGGQFILLATLSGAPASSNQVLLAGRATPTDNPIPRLILRKGDTLHTALTPSSVIKSISVQPFYDPGGVAGGSKRMLVNGGFAAAVVTLSSGAQELIRLDLSFL